MIPLLRTYLKCINYKLSKQLSTNTRERNDFKTVYKFPYINGIGLINRLKFYQTTLTAIALPGTTLLTQYDLLSFDDVVFTSTVGLAGLIPLYIVGHFANKLVGIVYLNEQKNLAKIAYLDFWGNRKDVEIPLQDITPFSEIPPSLTDTLYLKIQQYSSKGTMKLCLRYGVLDQNGFNKVFLS